MSRSTVRIAASLLVLFPLLALSSCGWNAFDPESFTTAARLVLERSDGSADFASVELPSKHRSLSTSGEVYYFNREGRRFVFFPQEIEEPNFYGGYIYSDDGEPPPDELLDKADEPPANLGAGWWRGSLSQKVLAGG